VRAVVMKKNIYSKYYDKYRKAIFELYKWRKAVLTGIKVKGDQPEYNAHYSLVFFTTFDLEYSHFEFLEDPDTVAWGRLLELYKDYMSKESYSIISNPSKRRVLCNFYIMRKQIRNENKEFQMVFPKRIKPKLSPHTWAKITRIIQKYKDRTYKHNEIVREFGDMGRIIKSENGRVSLELGEYKENLGGSNGEESKKDRNRRCRFGD
jgi:hypothetical protein